MHSINDKTYYIYSKFVKTELLSILKVKLSVNLLTLYVFFQYHFIGSIYFDANSHWHGSSKAYSPPYSQILLIWGFFENESRRLYNFSVSTYQVKFNNTNVVNGYHMVLINQRCKQLLWCMIYNVIWFLKNCKNVL